jgi:hypothetical protein
MKIYANLFSTWYGRYSTHILKPIDHFVMESYHKKLSGDHTSFIIYLPQFFENYGYCINMRYKRKTLSCHRERLKYIFVKMLAESLYELHNNSERCKFRKLVVSELATHDEI